jgi:hypothetical protein
MRLERRTQRVAVAVDDDAFAFVRMLYAARMAAMGIKSGPE